MQRQFVHSAIGRGRPDGVRATRILRASIRQLSTTPTRNVPEDAGSGRGDGQRPPSAKDRSRQAGREIGSMLSKPKPTGTSSRPTGGKVIDLSAMKAKLGSSPQKIINLKSLPRDAAGRSSPSPFAVPPTGPRPRDALGAPRNSPNDTRRGPRPSSQGSPTRGGARGGRGGARVGLRRRRRPGEEDGEDSARKPKDQQKQPVGGATSSGPEAELVPQTEGERLWLEEYKRGNPSVYNPSTTLESLRGYMPAVVTDAALQSRLGPAGTVMTNLRALSWAEPFENSGETRLAGLDNKKRLEWDGALLFSHVEDKAEISKITGREVEGPDETVRKAILEKTVMGRYETAEFIEDVKHDPVGLARSVHRMANTYSPHQTRSFEAKLASLMPGAKREAKTPGTPPGSAPAGAKKGAGKAEGKGGAQKKAAKSKSKA